MEEFLGLLRKRVRNNDTKAMNTLATHYANGLNGVAKDTESAFELWKKGAYLGDAESHWNLGYRFSQGCGITKHLKKAKHHYSLLWEEMPMLGFVLHFTSQRLIAIQSGQLNI
jgi:TPR repeat protein